MKLLIHIRKTSILQRTSILLFLLIMVQVIRAESVKPAENNILILNGILIIAVGILYYLHFNQPKQMTSVKTPEGKDTVVAVSPIEVPVSEEGLGSNVLYVDIDTINQKYNYIKTQKSIMEKQGAQAEASLKAKAKVLQDEIMAYQKKAQAGELTQQQAQTIEKGLGEKQQALAEQEQKLSDDLIRKTNKIQEELNRSHLFRLIKM